MHTTHAAGILASSLLTTMVFAGDPTDLLQGEAPVLFSGAEGEDANGTLLADGQAIRGDEIWLWVPALDGGGQVDLGATAQFFRIWDSGPVLGPDGNDDDANGMRGLDFDPISAAFLISYEDSTTTGFAFGNIRDGALMKMTPATIVNGFVTGHTFVQLYDEGVNGTPGFLSAGDINALCRAPDGTLFMGCGGTQTLQTVAPVGTLGVGPSTVAHVENIDGNPSPANLGPDKFYEAALTGCALSFCPGLYLGQLRGADVLSTGELTIGVSGEYSNTVFSGPIDGLTDAQADLLTLGIQLALQKADIGILRDHDDMALNTYQRRTAEVLYAGSLFYTSPHAGDSEILDHDILDTAPEITALIGVLGAGSDAGIALGAHVAPLGCLGDTDASGIVDIDDVINVVLQFGTDGQGVPGVDADVVANGIVDIDDVVAVVLAFGPCP